MTVPRLKSFLFVATMPNGSREDVLFYAADRATATRYARAWAEKQGCKVTCVPDEVAA